MFSFLLFLLPALLSSQVRVAYGAGVMGIDFGTDWFKAAVAKPRTLDLCLNKDSQRKTEALVTFRDGQRFFASEAVNLGLKKPQDSYGKLKNLLGRSFDDGLASEYRSTYDNTMLKDEERGTVLFQHDKNTTFAVEELVALLLTRARLDCEAFAEEPLRDAIITVPPFWTQHERRAILDAAELAGIRVLSLMNDETAVAMNYASMRTFDDEPQYHIFYDMGAGSTVASLIEFKTALDPAVKKYGKPTNTTMITVKASGFDRTLGGHVFDVRLQQHLAKLFTSSAAGKKAKQPVYQSQRAMAKLLREANRVKHILSANTVSSTSVEGLHEELDFRSSVSRDEFEVMIKDLLERVQGPIDTVLKSSGVKLSDIKSFVLVGGNVRIPAVQKKLEDFVGSDKIAKHVNGDESAVLGATLMGAVMSPFFRVPKQYKIEDILTHGIAFSYEGTKKGDDKNLRVVKQKLFKKESKTDVKKLVGFKKSSDFEFKLSYDDEAIAEDSQLSAADIAKVSVEGLEDTLKQANISADDASNLKVRVLLSLSSSGLVNVENATVDVTTVNGVGKTLGDSIKDTVMSFFGGTKEEKNKDSPPDEGNSEELKVDAQVNATNATLPANVTAPVEQQKTFILPFTFTQAGIPSLSEEAKTAIRSRFSAYREEDYRRKQREEARNALESFVYQTMDQLTRNDIVSVSTEEQRSALSEQLSESSTWLYDDGELPSTPTQEFVTRLTALKAVFDPIQLRAKELIDRPEAIEALRKTLSEVRGVLNASHFGLAVEDRLLSEQDVLPVSLSVNSTTTWLKEMEGKQSTLKLFEESVLSSKEVRERQTQIERELTMLNLKMKLALKKPKTTSSSSTSSSSTTSSSTTQTQQETPTVLPEKPVEGEEQEAEKEKKEEEMDSATEHDEL